MATDQIDNVIGYLMELKKLKSQLQLKDEEIRKYVDLLLTRKSNDYESFMIYSYDTDKEAINIIGQNLMEFSEMIYDHHYLLIARKEINRNFGIYLMPFEDDCNLATTLEAIEQLIEKKRTESENESFSVPSKKIVPEIKIITQKVADVDKNIEKMQDESARVQKTLEEHKARSDAKLNDMKNILEMGILQLSPFYRNFLVNQFYKQKNLEYIGNSPEILENMCMRLSMKIDGDRSETDPPFKDIISLKEKKKELIGYFDLLQKNLDGSTEVTVIQRNIKDWMTYNWPQLLYKPTTSEKEEWKKEMEQNLKVKNTIGTVSYIFFKWNGIDVYFSFCIANSKIIRWNWSPSKQEALESVYEALKNDMNWDTNEKFATDIDVSDDLSDYFVHVTTDEIMKISNNQKVVEWMTNNFEFHKYNVDDFNLLYSLPVIYSLALKYFEESIE